MWARKKNKPNNDSGFRAEPYRDDEHGQQGVAGKDGHDVALKKLGTKTR